MQWTFNRDMQAYESETRGPWHGVIRVIGPRFHAGIRHAAPMAVEAGPRFDELAQAEEWTEAQLVERVPRVAPALPARPTARSTLRPVHAPPQPRPCPLCYVAFPPAGAEGRPCRV
jgi:hypothetical protein